MDMELKQAILLQQQLVAEMDNPNRLGVLYSLYSIDVILQYWTLSCGCEPHEACLLIWLSLEPYVVFKKLNQVTIASVGTRVFCCASQKLHVIFFAIDLLGGCGDLISN